VECASGVKGRAETDGQNEFTRWKTGFYWENSQRVKGGGGEIRGKESPQKTSGLSGNINYMVQGLPTVGKGGLNKPKRVGRVGKSRLSGNKKDLSQLSIDQGKGVLKNLRGNS